MKSLKIEIFFRLKSVSPTDFFTLDRVEMAQGIVLQSLFVTITTGGFSISDRVKMAYGIVIQSLFVTKIIGKYKKIKSQGIVIQSLFITKRQLWVITKKNLLRLDAIINIFCFLIHEVLDICKLLQVNLFANFFNVIVLHVVGIWLYSWGKLFFFFLTAPLKLLVKYLVIENPLQNLPQKTKIDYFFQKVLNRSFWAFSTKKV